MCQNHCKNMLFKYLFLKKSNFFQEQTSIESSLILKERRPLSLSLSLSLSQISPVILSFLFFFPYFFLFVCFFTFSFNFCSWNYCECGIEKVCRSQIMEIYQYIRKKVKLHWDLKARLFVEYFNQCLGAAHSQCCSKICF